MDDQSQDRIQTTQRVSTQMDSQLSALRRRLLLAENRVQKFRSNHNLQQAEGELIDTRQLKLLNKQLIVARADVAKNEAKEQQVQQLLREGLDPDMLDDTIKSQTISRLRDQYAMAARREAILSASLLPAHPQMKQAHEEVERLRGLIRAEVERTAEGIKLDYEASKKRLVAAEAALAASRRDADVNDSARVKLSELMREAETTRAVYQSFLSRVKEMNESQRVFAPDARIISPAVIPGQPSSPRKRLILALALVFGCVLGGSLAIGVEHFDPRIHSGTELLTSTGLKLLASIPTLKVRRSFLGELLPKRMSRASFYDLVVEILEPNAGSGYRTAVLRLLSYLTDFDSSGHPRVVSLTSSRPGEGKSALALSFAVAAASSGMRTLLVDASSADPGLDQSVWE